MQPQDPLEVLFCDLCNTSVPLQDFEAGNAVRHAGKTIGGCCLPSLRSGPAPVRGAGSLADASPAAAPATQAENRAVPHDSRLLPLGIAVLGAVAAATLFLDYRIDQADSRWSRGSDDLATSLKSQAEVVQGIYVTLDTVVRRADVDRIQERLAAIDLAQQRAADQVMNLTKDHARAVEGLQAALQSMQEADRRRPDYGPSLDALRAQMQQQAVSLAEILAQPRAREAVPAAAVVQMPVVPGLAPELVHQIAKLKDEDAATRFEAVDELLRSKDPLVLEHLLPMVKDVDTFVRRLTVEGLKDFHKPAVVDVLIVALADPEEIVRDTAWRSLKGLTGQKLPFEAGGPREARARAQQKWQEWWDKNRDGFGA